MQRRVKKTSIQIIVAVSLIALFLSACSQSVTETTVAELFTSDTFASTEDKEETVSFTDSLGRLVEVPASIRTVAPSGPLAQLVLYTAVPEKLAGLARAFSLTQRRYVVEAYTTLPEFGQFYGKNTSLNMETLLAHAPDVVIDIGEAKPSAVEDMDKLQAQLNMPVVFIEAKLTDMPSTYRKLAELVGEKARLELLAESAQKTLTRAGELKESLQEDEIVSVYWAMGEKGLNTNAASSFHAEVLQLVGAKNVADVEASFAGMGTEISFEQVLNWQPDVILFDTLELKEMLENDHAWQTLDAIKNGRTHVVPGEPYGALANPPSVNRLLGIDWLGQTLYPDRYDLNLDEQFTSFYKQFYHYDLTQDQLDILLGRRD